MGIATGLSAPNENRIVQYLIGVIATVYTTTCAAWKKFLGCEYELDVVNKTVGISAPSTLEAINNELLEGVVIITSKHIYSEAFFGIPQGTVSPVGDDSRESFLAMQTLVRRGLGAYIWLGRAYPIAVAPTNILCANMHNPGMQTLACLRYMAMFMQANATCVEPHWETSDSGV